MKISAFEKQKLNMMTKTDNHFDLALIRGALFYNQTG